MNKEEILQRSREQKEDEGVIYSDNTGRRYGFIGLNIILSAYMILVVFFGGNFAIPMSFWCVFTGAECLGKHKTTGSKGELLGGIVLCVAAILFLLSYVLIDLTKVVGY